MPPQTSFQTKRSWRDLLFDARVRGWAAQVLTLAVLAYVVFFLASNAATNMRALGISSGFGFLGQEASFDISMTLVDYDLTDTHAKVFLVGALNTLLVSVLGILAATALGILIGIGRLSDNWLVAKLSLAYVEVFRNLPLLFQILFWYGLVLLWPKVRDSIAIGNSVFINNRGIEIPRLVFEEGSGLVGGALLIGLIVAYGVRRWAHRLHDQEGKTVPGLPLVMIAIAVGLPLLVALVLQFPWSYDLPVRKGFNYKGGISIPTSLVALWFSLTVYTGAFIAEIVRSGIAAVAPGQSEAAASLGLRSGMTMRLVVLPQALRVIVPPLISQYLNLTKNSSLAVAIGYPDLVNVFSGTSLNQTGQAIEVILMTMAFYLAISLTISLGMNIYNTRVAMKGGAPR
ncbi:MAG: amino acid ABC transporter permease [Alphaproteobacteria bacterium]|nr:MAG: amino acid ABC transporter permease [Alphaproteobacteria bacterium]